LNRKDLTRRYRNHLNASSPKEQLLKDKMSKYIRVTASSRGSTIRASDLDSASRERDRQATKIYRMHKEMETIQAMKTEFQ